MTLISECYRALAAEVISCALEDILPDDVRNQYVSDLNNIGDIPVKDRSRKQTKKRNTAAKRLTNDYDARIFFETRNFRLYAGMVKLEYADVYAAYIKRIKGEI
jgi:hypothetical protein